MDESGHTGDRYMGVGGIILRPERAAEIRSHIQRIKLAAGVKSELKWNEFRKPRLGVYQAMADYFFDLIDLNQIHFHLLICDFRKLDHRQNGGREGSVSRMLYQLSLHRGCKPYGEKSNLFLRPDSGDIADQFRAYHRHLNNSAKAHLPWKRCFETSPVAEIQATHSCLEPMLELNDIILGGAMHRRNERDSRPDASEHKKLLAAHIAKRAKHSRFAFSTPIWEKRFTVWNFASDRLAPGASPERAG